MQKDINELFKKRGIRYISEYQFHDKFESLCEGNSDFVTTSMNPLEELTLLNGFQLFNKDSFNDAFGVVSLFLDYSKNAKERNFLINLFSKEKDLPVYIKHWISLYSGEKNTYLYFAENHEDKKLIKSIGEIYSNKPKNYLIDTKMTDLFLKGLEKDTVYLKRKLMMLGKEPLKIMKKELNQK